MMKIVKKNKKRIYGKWVLTAVLLAVLPLGISGCGSSNKSMDASDADFNSHYGESVAADDVETAYGMQSNGAMESEDMDDSYDGAATSTEAAVEAKTSSSTPAKVTDAKKIIKRYYFNYETEEFDSAYAYLKAQIEKYNGYISSSNVAGTTYRTLDLTARIPADVSDEFAGQLGSLGTVVSQSESAEDITLQYTDTESRIKSLKTEQERLNALLEKADDLESIITLENRLTEVRYELENYQSRKNLYDDLVTYSTVNITLREVVYTVAVDDGSFFSRITTGLESTFRDIKISAADFLVWLIVNLPYIIIWVLIIFVIVKIIRMLIRGRKKKKQAKRDAKANVSSESQNQIESPDVENNEADTDLNND